MPPITPIVVALAPGCAIVGAAVTVTGSEVEVPDTVTVFAQIVLTPLALSVKVTVALKFPLVVYV